MAWRVTLPSVEGRVTNSGGVKLYSAMSGSSFLKIVICVRPSLRDFSTAAPGRSTALEMSTKVSLEHSSTITPCVPGSLVIRSGSPCPSRRARNRCRPSQSPWLVPMKYTKPAFSSTAAISSTCHSPLVTGVKAFVAGSKMYRWRWPVRSLAHKNLPVFPRGFSMSCTLIQTSLFSVKSKLDLPVLGKTCRTASSDCSRFKTCTASVPSGIHCTRAR
mmetsp:Transcript_14876/g.42184  ORF Transcript_14876/g.42184 Transcript_14876/m.42184 type:complete len:217 (+) Transcript_14876:802-1452(+)